MPPKKKQKQQAKKVDKKSPSPPSKKPEARKSVRTAKQTQQQPHSRSPSPQPKKVVKKDSSPPKKDKKPDTPQKPDTPEKKMVNLKMKGDAPVDQYCSKQDVAHVFSKDGKVYSATLNQSNLGANNNKFYVIQVLQSDSSPSTFWCFNRWGRVGVEGQIALKGTNYKHPYIKFQGPFNEQTAIKEFDKKHNEKTVKGDYTEIQIDWTSKDNEVLNLFDQQKQEETKADENPQPKIAKRTSAPSTLHPSVQNLIKLIFDLKIMEQTMKEIGYDAKKMPLGKLADATVKDGYEVLTKLNDEVNSKARKKQNIIDLSSQFYSLIPHDFGFQKMINFILDTEEKVKEKLEMLKTLTDMKIATKILSDKTNDHEDIIDQNYKKLNCNLNPIDFNSEKFKQINTFIQNTRENWKAKVIDCFEIDRVGEKARFDKSIGNNILLWHGSRVSNYVGILSQGLRIAPPEAPVSGYLYGKGIYFADMFGKSAHYCRGGTSGNEILIMLCDVAVGNPNILQSPNCNAAQLPAGTHSTFGWGQQGPSESGYKYLDDTEVPVKIPLGMPEKTKSTNYMSHNEFIVYKLEQARLHYLLRIRLE